MTLQNQILTKQATFTESFYRARLSYKVPTPAIDLPIEILYLILPLLSKTDLLSLRLVCHQLSALAVPYADDRLIHEIHKGTHFHLHRAVTTSSDATILQRLLHRGAPVNHRNSAGESALHAASRHGNLYAVGILLLSGAAIDATTTHNWTPLHLACRYGHTDIAEHLIYRGATVNNPGFHGWTALHYAIRGGHTDCVRLLRAAGAEEPPSYKCAAKHMRNYGWGVYTPLHLQNM